MFVASSGVSLSGIGLSQENLDPAPRAIGSDATQGDQSQSDSISRATPLAPSSVLQDCNAGRSDMIVP